MVSGVFRQSILRMATPPPMLGRIEGVGMAVWTTGPALGDLEAGAVAAVTTVDTSIVIGGLACIGGIAVLALAMPALIAYNAHRDAVVVTRARSRLTRRYLPRAVYAVPPPTEVDRLHVRGSSCSSS